MESQLSSTIIENPEMLKYQQERQGNPNPNGAQGSGPENQTHKLTNVLNGESLEDIRKVRRKNMQQYTQQMIGIVYILKNYFGK